ncbi:MAG: hypothetical protein JXB32_13225 [Deltaproteobacteria bacterium]|nr:hypothetical protein [Deltaproteobacteria bacterium]
MRAACILLIGGWLGCGCGPATAPVDVPVEVPSTVLEVGPGELEAYGSTSDLLVLALRAEPPRLVLVAPAEGTVRALPWPLDPAATCDRVVPAGARVCAAGYDAGVACVPVDGGGPPEPLALAAPPTGLVWADDALWIATDGAGLWRAVPGAAPEQAAAVRDLMHGLVAGPFGLVWGNGGEYAWRTHVLRRGEDEPQWLRPPLPPNVRCRDEMEVCEWLSQALGWAHERVWFAAANAPAPLYSWTPQSGEWHEFQPGGEVHVGPDEVWVVHADGLVERYGAARESFEPVAERLSPGEVAVAAAGGLWSLGRGTLRLLVPAQR